MWYIRENDELIVFIYVQPGAKSTEIVGIHDGALKIRLNALPIDGRANDVLKKFLAKQFHVAASKVQLIQGEKSKKKKFLILGTEVDPASLSQILK
ncbi:MAG TPA: DUF167 family protein [Legionella sp.]|nr:DUF167 family protein [Legionella sp.]